MPIKVQCPNAACGQVITVRDEHAGKRGKCPTCGSAMMIPAASGRETVAPRQTPGPRGQPRSDEVAAVTDAPLSTPASQPADLRLPPTDAEHIGPTDEPARRPTTRRRPGPLAGYPMAELATRTAMVVGIVALVVLSLIPQVPWLYVSSSTKEPAGRGQAALLQQVFTGGLGAQGPGTTLLVFSALLAFLSILGLLLLDSLPRETSDSVIAAVGGMAGGWGVTVFFWLVGYVWKAFSLASEIGSKNLTVLPGAGLVLGLFASLAIIAVFGYLVISRRRFIWLGTAAGLGFFFGLFLLIFNARPWDAGFVGPR